MSDETPAVELPKSKRPRHRKSELRVVFDTNPLYVVGSASDLIQEEIVNLIRDSKYPDLDLLWFLPEVVRHERQYQMQTEAQKFRSAITKIERLLNHNLALTDAVLLDRVATRIDEQQRELGLRELKVDYSKVEWSGMIEAACYRRPPFSTGESEKGFRDAIVVEAFMQLIDASPKTAKICRLVLVTSDELLTRAVAERTASQSNVSVLPGVPELRGLINTLISNVDEDFIASVKPKAANLFFTSGEDKTTLYFTEQIEKRIVGKFQNEFLAKPQNTTFRKDGQWYVSQPNFSRKEGRRIMWSSRIWVAVEAGNVVRSQEPGILGGSPAALTALTGSYSLADAYRAITGREEKGVSGLFPASVRRLSDLMPLLEPKKEVVTHKGRDVYQVLWSTEVTLKKELRKPKIDEITHVECDWQAV